MSDYYELAVTQMFIDAEYPISVPYVVNICQGYPLKKTSTNIKGNLGGEKNTKTTG